jgi:hypothetical protein
MRINNQLIVQMELSFKSPRESISEFRFDNSTLKTDLQAYIENVETAGSFALFKSVNQAPNPGLYIKGAGTIGLPLSDRDAEALIKASHQAPFGKGSQTVVDVSVRKTWNCQRAISK